LNDETARVRSGSRIESLPFSKLPHQTKLFLDYLDDPLALKNYYPNAVRTPLDVAEFAGNVLANYTTDRNAICDALERINHGVGAAAPTFNNIIRLRHADTVAVVTGQQAGLFTGPLYTIYKALSAVRMADILNRAGTPAVPVFWVASEDHDMDEVSHTSFLSSGGGLFDARFRPRGGVRDAPVGRVLLDESIGKVVTDVFGELGHSEIAISIQNRIAAAWSAGTSYSDAFARDLVAMLGKFGLIVIDPLDEQLKKLASPIYTAAVEKSAEIVEAIRARSLGLVERGYHAQVLVEEDYFPLFWHTDDGRRVALRKIGDARYRSRGAGREFTIEELSSLARVEPQRFSPGVMLRPVVQDHLLPTICYFGGAAEIAYFAQNSEAYRVLGRPVTPILHRQSLTIVEPREQRVFDKLGIKFEDVFDGLTTVLERSVEKVMSPELADLFENVDKNIGIELDRLDREMSGLDPAVAANLATRRRKITYHIAALRKKAYASKLKKEETVERQVRALFDALLPKGELQERVINVHSYLVKYDVNFVDRLYDGVDLEDRGHRIIHI
jgi:bacillithiol biosynthesis cysteine-adding enzyme BshC